ncbi:MAG: Ig-like domain-containing protein [Solirubrobacterales bacterium]
MTRLPRSPSTLLGTLITAALLCAVTAGIAGAYWTAGGSGGGSGAAATMPAGVTPTFTNSGTTVTISITQVALSGTNIGARANGGYRVKRYPAAGGAGVTIPAGTCSSLVTGAAATLTCTETSTPRGDWKYTVTPILSGWSGAESATSATLTLAPDAATGLGLTLQPAAAVALSWTAGAGATGYNVYRRTSTGAYNYATPVNGSTPISGTTYTDTTPTSGTAYTYVVRSVVTGSSGQQIESGNSNEPATVTADGTVPTGVTLNAVATPLTGSLTLSGAATDTVSGMKNIAFQYKLSSGSTWTTACTATTSPYSCSFATTSVADGLYDFRALASDNVGNQTASTVQTSRRIDNTAPVAVATNPGTYVRGNITLGGTAAETGSGVASMQLNGRAVGAGAWTTVCTGTASPLSCTYDTTGIADGTYEVQLVATDAAGNVGTSSTVTPIYVDNTAPTATMTDPGANNAGVETLASTVSDATSGLATVTYQYKLNSGTTWSTACSSTATPYTCSFNTGSVADGLYDFRVIAVDNAGNSTTSATIASRRIDNTAPTVTLTSPGSPIRGAVTLNATSADGGSGVASVVFAYKLSSGSTWTTIATDTATPYTTTWTTTALNGTYDIRAVSTDNAGNSTTSTVTNIVVDNTAPTASNIANANGSGTAGRPDSGDTMTYTFSEAMSPTSILAGWSGASTAVTVRLTNAATDTFTVYNAANNTLLPLGSVTIGTNWVSANATFAATMVMSGSAITVTLGTMSGGTVATSTSTFLMVWTPSATATDVAGNAMSTTTRSAGAGTVRLF